MLETGMKHIPTEVCNLLLHDLNTSRHNKQVRLTFRMCILQYDSE
jgi:hypothetical protein